MTRAALLFLVLSCLSAVVVGWGVRHWALAAALVALGTAGLSLIAETSASWPAAKSVTPLVTGAGLAGLVLVPLLLLRPRASAPNRILPALIATFAAHFTYLKYALASR